MSPVLPLMFGLRSQLADNEEASDQGVVSSFKESFRTQLTQRFSLNDLVLSSLPILCSALDPRFRSLSFLTLTEREEVKQTLIKMVKRPKRPFSRYHICTGVKHWHQASQENEQEGRHPCTAIRPE